MPDLCASCTRGIVGRPHVMLAYFQVQHPGDDVEALCGECWEQMIEWASCASSGFVAEWIANEALLPVEYPAER